MPALHALEDFLDRYLDQVHHGLPPLSSDQAKELEQIAINIALHDNGRFEAVFREIAVLQHLKERSSHEAILRVEVIKRLRQAIMGSRLTA